METQSDCAELKLGTYKILLQTVKSDDRFKVVSKVTSSLGMNEEIATSLLIFAHLISIRSLYGGKDVSREELLERVTERVTDALKKILEAEAEGENQL